MSDTSFFRRLQFDCVVVDEAARIKNCRSKLIGVLRSAITCRFRLLLSGTPLQNNIRELFTLLQFVHGTVFHSFTEFDAVFGRIVFVGRGTCSRISGQASRRITDINYITEDDVEVDENADSDAESGAGLETDVAVTDAGAVTYPDDTIAVDRDGPSTAHSGVFSAAPSTNICDETSHATTQTYQTAISIAPTSISTHAVQ